jgi:hypothetical protein
MNQTLIEPFIFDRFERRSSTITSPTIQKEIIIKIVDKAKAMYIDKNIDKTQFDNEYNDDTNNDEIDSYDYNNPIYEMPFDERFERWYKWDKYRFCTFELNTIFLLTIINILSKDYSQTSLFYINFWEFLNHHLSEEEIQACKLNILL